MKWWWADRLPFADVRTRPASDFMKKLEREAMDKARKAAAAVFFAKKRPTSKDEIKLAPLIERLAEFSLRFQRKVLVDHK